MAIPSLSTSKPSSAWRREGADNAKKASRRDVDMGNVKCRYVGMIK